MFGNVAALGVILSHLHLDAREEEVGHDQPYRLIGTVLNLRTTTSHKCAAVPRRARI